MPEQRPIVSYAATPVFLLTDQWKQVYAALQMQLPLRNLHWKSPSRAAIRTIQELHVNLTALDTLRDEHTSQVPQTLLDRPLLNVYFVACEDNETYKATVRKQIKDWHSVISQRRNQEWLIVHIVRPEGKATQSGLFQIKASVLDKIRADFNTDKRDRCVQLVWSLDFEDPTAWADLIIKVKEGVLSAFDGALSQREDEVKRSEAQRHMPGWNFCTFFILKESLAISLEGMNLYEDSLEEYEELEASFLQVLRDRNLSWFGPLISPSTRNDSEPILSVDKKPYRDMILANSISIFDFRVYLLARQCLLLSKMGDVIDICKKVAAFLNTFGRRLRDSEGLPQYFVESWIYSSALSVVGECESWARGITLPKAKLAVFNAAKAELLETARHQLDIIGVGMGFLPPLPPFSMALPSAVVHTTSGDGNVPESIGNKELASAVGNKDLFHDFYIQLTNRAIELYARAGRRKFAIKLHGDLAALDLLRGRVGNALQTYSSLPAHYAPHRWASLEAFMLTRALELHDSSEKEKDKDWIHLVLEFLKAYVDDFGKELIMLEIEREQYLTNLLTSLKDTATGLQSDLIHFEHPAITLTVSSRTAQLAGTRDGALLNITVHNRLPCAIAANEVGVSLVGRDGVKVLFSANVSSIPPGVSKLTLFCASAASGVYTVQTYEITISHLLLQWQSQRGATSNKSQRPYTQPVLVHVPRDFQALDIQLRPPDSIELGKPPRIVFVVSTGRNDVANATVRLSAPSGARFDVAEAILDGENAALQIHDDFVVLSNISSGEKVTVSVPHLDTSSYAFLKVDVAVDYVTTSEPNLTRTLEVTRVVPIALPVEINIEDFFRGTRVFTRFTLSTISHQHIRVRSAELMATEPEGSGIKIVSCTSPKSHVITITPSRPAKFLFQLHSGKGHSRDPLRLRVVYRMFREEVETLIEKTVEQVVEGLPKLQSCRLLLTDRLTQALESDAKWVELYDITGEVIVPKWIDDGEEDLRQGLQRAHEILAQRKGIRLNEWRELVIPVDVPQMHILAAARLEILPAQYPKRPSGGELIPLFAGQPVPAVVTITTSFHWAPKDELARSKYRMRYDIEDMPHDWLISGRKRGTFTAEDGGSFAIAITLIAVHHGEFALPQVGVTPLPVAGEYRMGSAAVPACRTHQVHGAEKVLVLPRGGRNTYVVSMGEPEEIAR
ncbi:hypothetical protein CERSUDRAFT_153326 [Gelatoporia subvermispora B]|uniref:Trafficking protein particle complex subunit 10 n=1 Tax=Ceriporiopsis subvermispora (strain B) TaxID=914234 RepID=M2RI43_CERS8|nr:hypothetical protein CERSUDRAFT_153326 [Gelatoporia subvermispora B]